MNPMQLSTKELIERIAKVLPKDIAADYYREMLYCCSLPESDEMLRILRILQILTLIMDRIPSRVMEEREAIERLFREAVQALKMVLSSSELFHKQLDLRLSRLPAAIAEGIRPEAIAATINESLHQQFVTSTIPQTAQALAVIAEQMKKVSSEFSSTANDIGSSYMEAAEQARRAIDNIRTSVTQAGNAAQQTTEELSVKFKNAYWVTLIVLTMAALLTGFWLGVFLVRKFDPPKQEVIERIIEPMPAPAPPVKPRRR